MLSGEISRNLTKIINLRSPTSDEFVNLPDLSYFHVVDKNDYLTFSNASLDCDITQIN